MLYYSFKNYEEFKEIFGIVEHGNGVKSRKNKILLSMYKDRNVLHKYIEHLSYISYDKMVDDYLSRKYRRNWALDAVSQAHLHRLDSMSDAADRIRCSYPYEVRSYNLLDITELDVLKCCLIDIMTNRGLRVDGADYRMDLNEKIYSSDMYETDDMGGLCEDGTVNAIRYRNVEKGKTFKMKAGKMFNHLLECNVITKDLPEQIKRWLSEEWVAMWIDYARNNVSETEYTLHVDDNFADIYDSARCAGYDESSNCFGSCMVDDDQWTFYRDAVDAKAAYLTDSDGMIVARCIIFTDVKDQDGRKWRLAERQYSKFCEYGLQRQLISALIKGGHIDGYKSIGASCGDATRFVDCDGNSLSDKKFSIRCRLEDGDTISYQDSFKWFVPDSMRAYNHEHGSDCLSLDTTDGSIDFEAGRVWSDYNDEYIPEDEAVYVESRDDYFWENQTVMAYVYHSGSGRYYEENCFEEDCVEIGNNYYYAGYYCEDKAGNGIYECPECGELFVPEHDSYYSEVTEEDYCCSYCREQAEKSYKEKYWYYSEYDDDYAEDEDDVVPALLWNVVDACYDKTTVFRDTVDSLVRRRCAGYVDDVCYIDFIGYDGEPAHLMAEVCVA